jgi:hypothetical protein
MPMGFSVPARSGSIPILRTMVVGAGADTEVSVDALEDLALAVHETAVAFLTSGATRLDLGVDAGRTSLRVSIGSDVRISPWPPPDWEDTLSGRVVSALADSVEHRADPTGPVVTLTGSRAGT